jgi:hypothetical protein
MSDARDWYGPPGGIVPGIVPIETVIARSAAYAVYIGRCVAYPAGFEFELCVASAQEASGLDPSLNGPIVSSDPASRTQRSTLRIEIRFSDGSSVDNLGQLAPIGKPTQPFLRGLGGHGDGATWLQRFWIWPIPTSGDVMFSCDWPAAGIPVTTTPLSASSIRAAAGRAIQLFPSGPTRGPESTWATIGIRSHIRSSS